MLKFRLEYFDSLNSLIITKFIEANNLLEAVILVEKDLDKNTIEYRGGWKI